MNVAVIAGLVRSQIKRVETFVQHTGVAFLDNWTIVYIAARRNSPDIAVEDVRMVMEQAAEHQRPHIIGVSTQDRRVRQQVAKEIKEYFRFRWLDNRLLSYLGNNFKSFVVGVNDTLAEEEIWSDVVRPQDSRSPLLLPRMSFEAARPFRELWELSEQYGDIGNIEHAGSQVDRFRMQHFVHLETGNPRKWLDVTDKVFDHTGERHALAPFPRNWKYSFQMEEGFHFDVSDKNRRSFNLRDYATRIHTVKANGYINVDAHGYVRTGRASPN